MIGLKLLKYSLSSKLLAFIFQVLSMSIMMVSRLDTLDCNGRQFLTILGSQPVLGNNEHWWDHSFVLRSIYVMIDQNHERYNTLHHA